MLYLRFLHAPIQNCQDLEKSTGSCDLYDVKAFRVPKDTSPYINMSFPQDPREAYLR